MSTYGEQQQQAKTCFATIPAWVINPQTQTRLLFLTIPPWEEAFLQRSCEGRSQWDSRCLKVPSSTAETNSRTQFLKEFVSRIIRKFPKAFFLDMDQVCVLLQGILSCQRLIIICTQHNYLFSATFTDQQPVIKNVCKTELFQIRIKTLKGTRCHRGAWIRAYCVWWGLSCHCGQIWSVSYQNLRLPEEKRGVRNVLFSYKMKGV